MNKLLLILTLFLFLPLVSASLIIDPNPLTETVSVGATYQFPVQISNNFNFSIFNITFSEVPNVVFETIGEINQQSTAQAVVTIQMDAQENVNYQSIVSFFYSGNFTQDNVIHNIDINGESGGYFDPSSLTILQGDTIIFNNTDTISHNILSGSLFDETIPPGGSFSFTFPSPGDITIIDATFLFECQVHIQSNVQGELIHNSDYDVIFNLNLNSMYSLTNLSIELLASNYTVINKEKTDGLLKITNTGQEPAITTHLSSDYDWIEFAQNDFDMSIGSTKYIPFTIKPDFTARNKTNKEYQIPIKAKAINSEQKEITIDVFIPLDDSLYDIPEEVNIEYYISMIEELLKKLTDYNKTIQNLTDDSVVWANVTKEQVYSALRGSRESTDQMSRIELLVQGLLDNFGLLDTKINTIEVELNATQTHYEEEMKKSSDLNIFLSLLLGTLIIGGGSFYLYSKQKKSSKKERSMELFRGIKDPRKEK